MASVNKATILGNLGKDPEVRYSQSGSAIASLSVATTEKWNDRDGNKQEKTEWHRCTAFGRAAEVIAEYLQKGDPIYIEGRIETQKWQDRDGNDRWTTSIIVREFQMLGKKRSGDGESRGPSAEPSQQHESGLTPPGDFDDDIPF